MSDSNDFRSRIQKIEAKSALLNGGTVDDDGAVVTREAKPARRLNTPMMRVVIFSVVFFAGAAAGLPYLMEKFPEKFALNLPTGKIPKDVAETSKPLRERLVEMSSLSRKPRPKPEKIRQDTEHGFILRSPSVLNILGEDMVVDDLVDGFERISADTPTGAVTAFNRVTECGFRKPAPGEKVAGVRLTDAMLETPLQAFTKSEMANRLLKAIQGSLKYGREVEKIGFYEGNVTAVDVFVTDTSAPIYLVLQARGEGKLWHIHLADGVKLAHVALIGSTAPALTVPQDGLTYQSMIPQDFIGRIDFFEGTDFPDCMPLPWHKPQADWIAYQRSLKDNDLYKNQMKTYGNGFGAYDKWYTSVFGVSATYNTVQAAAAAHVLVGPVPDQKMTYRQFTGADVMITSNDYIFSGEKNVRAGHTAKLYEDLLVAASGGNFDLIKFGEVTGPVK